MVVHARAWLATWALWAFCCLATAQHRKWTPSTYPNPQKDADLCGRQGVKSSVCDPDGILSWEAANMVDGLINEIAEGVSPYKKAECDAVGMRGFQVAVALMHKMDHRKHADKAAAAKAFARALHDNWGVGNPACQNGVLLLLAISDREVYISTGRGVKAIVPDSQLTVLLDNIRPALKHKRYADAVLQAVQQLGLLMSGQQPDPTGVDSDDGWGIFTFFCICVATVMGWAWFGNKRQNTRFKRCADRLEAIKRDQSAIRSRQYAASSCPICLEDFDAPVSHPDAAGTSAGASAGTSSSSSSAAAAAAAADDNSSASPSAPLLSSQAGSSAGASRPSSSSAAAAAAAAGIAAAGSSSSSRIGKKGSGGKKGPPRKPLVLHCGHAFCDPCISQWLKSHTNCPICRKDLEDNDDQPSTRPASPPPTSCAANAAAAQENVWQQQVWLPELGFRLRRLRMMYPDFITDPMLYAWEEDLAAGRTLDVASVVQALNAARQQELESAGRSGASSGAFFGGGSSRGGGGSGSSW